eukprot:GEMP01126791.1.p1 GENE.GEMP01126791.1~~GEMP01126791.1.p1  ORF type:complete len:127 (+),score=35.55 GEMP01126791.1:76-456(+)
MKVLALAAIAASYILRGPGADVLVGHLKNMVETYVDGYGDHKNDCQRQDARMGKLSDAALDIQSKESVIRERQRLQADCDATLKTKAGFIKSLDDALNTLRPHQKWLERYPELKTSIDKIYEEDRS